MAKNHLTLGIYPNGSYVYNVVRDEDLEEHIAYNKLWRLGRLLYVDGKRVYGGCQKESSLAKFDRIAEEFYKENEINLCRPTISYR